MITRSGVLKAVVVAMVLVGTAGCTQRMIDFTVISNKNVMLRRAAGDDATRVEGKDQVYWLFTIPLGRPNMEEAVDRAIESAGPEYDALIDGVIYQYNYWFVLSGVSGIRVTGMPVVSSRLQVGMLDDKPALFHSRTGISNAAALASLPYVVVDKNGEPVESTLPERLESEAGVNR